MKYLPFISSILLYLGVANLPIGYFTFLRIAVFVIALVLAFGNELEAQGFFFFAFIAIAILFNPILPIYLHSKISWIVLDILSGTTFLIYGIRYFRIQPND